jgi:hypothetical protein
MNAQRLMTKITDFSENHLSIPGSDYHFALKTAIQHIPVSYKSSNAGGHYLCFTKLTNNKWLQISDAIATEVEHLPLLLKDVYFLLYEKL